MNGLFIVLDGYSLTYRAFYALQNMLHTTDGRYTNAVYGMAMMLNRLLTDYEPGYVVAAFDKGKATVRLEQYAEYKAGRQKMPVEMAEQMPYIFDLLHAWNIPIVEQEGHEADDIIGTLTLKAEAMGLNSLIVTGDRDALQLASPGTEILLTRKGVTELARYGVARIDEEYGVVPPQLIDVKAIMGDASDNIPGVNGIGEKGALALIREYGSLESVLEKAETLKSARQREALAAGAASAILSKKLATINRALEVEFEPEEWRFEGPDIPRLRRLYEDLELRSLLDKLPREEKVAPQGMLPLGLETVSVGPDFDWDEAWQQAKQNGMAVLTVGDSGFAFSVKAGQGAFLPSAVAPAVWWEMLADAHVSKIGFDLKALAAALQKQGRVLAGERSDALLAMYLLDPSRSAYHVDTWLGLPETDWDEALWATAAGLMHEAWKKLETTLKEEELWELLTQVETPLSLVLGKMERTGVAVDAEVLRAMSRETDSALNRLMAAIYEEAGQAFNINSPKQLGFVLFEKLKLPIIKKTKTGYSTDASVLEELAPANPIVNKILDYRALVKLKGTYIDGLLAVINPADGRIHTTYNQAVTSTGRLSSSEPNLQNIPVRVEEGRRIRQAFVPGEGFDYILAGDYSQIELRILAHISGDQKLRQAFIDGEDIHTRTAAEVAGVSLDQVTKEMRSRAKAVNFGIVYGISDYGLSNNLGISRAEARAYIEFYFERYPDVKRYMDEIVKIARRDGYVTTLLKRRRYLADINGRNFAQRSFAERTAMNTPIQGSAADLIKLAMVNIDREMERRNLKARMLLQVHDELIFEVTKDEMREVADLVKNCMEQALQLTVPLNVDLKYGCNWYAMVPMEEI
jgi:DNA polymerase-1